MADETYYAWSTIYAGGESQLIQSATGVSRKIIQSRNIINVGDKVSKADVKKFGGTDADWDALVEGGSIRTYPYPELPAGSVQSPTDFVLESIRGGQEEIPQDTLVQLVLQQNQLHQIGGTTEQQVREVAKNAQEELAK